MSQAPSKCPSKWIKVDKWNHLKNPSHKFKIIFLFRVSMNPQTHWKVKLERVHFLKVQSDRIIVCRPNVHHLKMHQSILLHIALVLPELLLKLHLQLPLKKQYLKWLLVLEVKAYFETFQVNKMLFPEMYTQKSFYDSLGN